MPWLPVSFHEPSLPGAGVDSPPPAARRLRLPRSDRGGGAPLLDVRIVAAQFLLALFALFLLALVAVALDHDGEPDGCLVEDQKRDGQAALADRIGGRDDGGDDEDD